MYTMEPVTITAAVNTCNSQYETAKVSNSEDNDFVFVYLCVFCNEQINSKKLLVKHLSNDHFVELNVQEKKTDKQGSFSSITFEKDEEKNSTKLDKFKRVLVDTTKSCPNENDDNIKEGCKIHERNIYSDEEGFDFNQYLRDLNATVDAESGLKIRDTENVDEKQSQISDDGSKEISLNKIKTKSKAISSENEKSKRSKKHFECFHCEKIYRSQSALLNHRKVHETVQKKECPYINCSKAFTSTAGYFHHMQTHTREVKYPCPSCEKGFYQKCNLTTHIRRCHTFEKPFSCQYCKKSFASRTDRQKHELFHTGEKPFVCDICDKGFTTSTKMKYHRKIHTKVKKFSCKICSQIFPNRALLYKHGKTHKS